MCHFRTVALEGAVSKKISLKSSGSVVEHIELWVSLSSENAN